MLKNASATEKLFNPRWDWEQLFSGIPAKPVTNVVTCGAAHASTSSPMASASLAVPVAPLRSSSSPTISQWLYVSALSTIYYIISICLSLFLPTYLFYHFTSSTTSNTDFLKSWPRGLCYTFSCPAISPEVREAT